MGNYQTKNPLDTLKSQVSKLGNVLPFGDDDLIRLARCHSYLRHAPASNTNSSSFLTQWAMYSSTLPPANFSEVNPNAPYRDILQFDSNITLFLQNNKEGHRRIGFIQKVMNVVEEHILPKGFGNSLYRTAFSLPNSMNNVNRNKDDKNYQNYGNENEIELMNQLEKFLDGIAQCTRRTSRHSLTVLFRSCCSSGKEEKVNANELIDLIYRIALACSFLSTAFSSFYNNNNDEDAIDLEELLGCPLSCFFPSTTKNTNDSNIGCDVLSQSLLDYSKKISSSSLGKYDGSSTMTLDYGQEQHTFAAAPPPSTNSLSTASINTTSDDKKDINEKEFVTLNIFLQWSETTTPCLCTCLETFLHTIFFSNKNMEEYPPTKTKFIYPNLNGKESAFFTSKEQGSNTSSLLFGFGVISPSLGGVWHRLYTSDSDGLSFNRLLNALLGYDGPTLLIIKEIEAGGIFGSYNSTAWKESKNFYGNSDCFLFSVSPSLSIYRPSSSCSGPTNSNNDSNNYMYCNSESRSKGYDKQPHGIGFGGTIDKPRIFIPESFDGCMASSGDLTFESGRILPPTTGTITNRKYFDLESLEVWGVGGDERVLQALGARNKQREIVAANIRKARKVDKAAFLDDFKSGLIESKAFQHRDQIRGRGDCHIDDEHKNNYIYEK